jgi:hypothetical protein
VHDLDVEDGDLYQGVSRLSFSSVGRTPAISCEAVPASEMVRRGHEPALLPRKVARESFVSFIALFGGMPLFPRCAALYRQKTS